MTKLKAQLKTGRDRFIRLIRWLRHGDMESVSFFDSTSPELKSGTRKNRRDFFGRWIFLVKEVTRRAHALSLQESRPLIPDPLEGAPECYAKWAVGAAYKNAFYTLDRTEGELRLKPDPSLQGFYFFVGKQGQNETGKNDELHIWMEGETTQTILTRGAASMATDWEIYYFEIKGGLPKPARLRWKILIPLKVLVSAPVIKTAAKPRRIIVLIADGLRPQDLGLYSGVTDTPQIDSFFSGGSIFDNSLSQSNWTLPTFASMALSQYASKHGLVDPDLYSRPMDRSIPTLAEGLREHGFYTYASVSHRRCNQALGHHRGFEHFRYAQTVDGKYGTPGVAGSNTMGLQLNEFKSYLKNLANIPFFGFVHLFETHFPFLNNPLSLRQAPFKETEDLSRLVKKSFKGNLGEEDLEQLMKAYRGKLRELDDALGELFWLLSRMEDTTVILTSDHGYSFKDPLGKYLSDDEIRTPFLVRSTEFKLRSGHFSRPVESSIDLLPTLFSWCGIKDKSERDGTPIFSSTGEVTDKKAAVSELIYLNNYRLKIVDENRRSLLVTTSRDRQSGRIDLENLTLENSENPIDSSILPTLKLAPALREKVLEKFESTLPASAQYAKAPIIQRRNP